jgi:hypothetical protein
LKPNLSKIATATNEYHFSYRADKYNKQDEQEKVFTITIDSSKRFFDNFNEKEAVKGIWEDSEYFGIVFEKI